MRKLARWGWLLLGVWAVLDWVRVPAKHPYLLAGLVLVFVLAAVREYRRRARPEK